MKRHHLIVRITHWVNVVALTIMIGSGLRIFNAYPAFARKGETFCCYPFEGHRIPGVAHVRRLAGGARNWHFAMMWVLVVNGLVYLGFIYLHGEWRDLVPRRGIVRDAWQMMKFYLSLRKDHPHQGKHNALQRLAYFAMPILAIARGLYGPRDLEAGAARPLTALLAGSSGRASGTSSRCCCSSSLTIGHVFMVFAVDPYSLRVDDHRRYNERRSPEARNARPFFHLLPRRAWTAARRFRRAAEPLPRRAPASGRAARNRPAALPRARAAAARRRARLLAACNTPGRERAKPLLASRSARTRRVERALFRHTSINVPPPARAPPGELSRRTSSPTGAGLGPGARAASGPRGRRRCASRSGCRSTISMALPRIGQQLDHFCVEGWNAVAMCTGVR